MNRPHPSASAVGGHFLPQQPHRSAKRTASHFFDVQTKRRRLDSQLAAIFGDPETRPVDQTSGDQSTILPTAVTPSTPGSEHGPFPLHSEIEVGAVLNSTRRTTPDQGDLKLASAWKAQIPTLLDDLLYYYQESAGKPLTAICDRLMDDCPLKRCGKPSTSKVLALYFGHFCSIEVTHCSCRTLPQALVRAGLFPTAPLHPRMAVSVDFLDFYSALFKRSCDALTAMSAAMNAFYTRRGFRMLNKKAEKVREPFRRGLGYASQWLEYLHLELERRLERSLHIADQQIRGCVPEVTDLPSKLTLQSTLRPSTILECSRMLRQLCPACFGLESFGRSLEEGGDIHVSTDGCFHHRHLVSAGQGVTYQEDKQLLPNDFVEAVGQRIENARRSPRRCRKLKVPDEAVDECESSYAAARGDKKGGASGGQRYDAYGWMALTCRHDVPLILANINTPGEQQKYSIALLLWLFSQLPANATVTLFYDIGCVLERSVELYDILPAHIASRVQFATSAMHAYGHQWACQLAHNPRMMKGLGLSDGEGVERTWSKTRVLIPITRTSSLAKRASLTARQVAYIALEVLTSLGDWLAKRHKHRVSERERAQAVLSKHGIPLTELRQQWALQKESQMAIRSHVPSRLKNELEAVINLQTELDKVDQAIGLVKSSAFDPHLTSAVLAKLSATQEELVKNAEALYTSLNIDASFPHLDDADRSFALALLLARDLKINIRKRAIGSFFEWDRLDQAVAGRNHTLGTKVHQDTRTSIKKRQPALLNSIRRYNQYCLQLEALYRPTYRIPLPAALPTTLVNLREDSTLMQDVWVDLLNQDPPRWLDDPKIQTGIQAMLRHDRSSEEGERLDLEAQNMCRMFGRDLAAVGVALLDPRNESIRLQLLMHLDHLLDLRDRWTHALGHTFNFDSRIQAAEAAASRIYGGASFSRPSSAATMLTHIEDLELETTSLPERERFERTVTFNDPEEEADSLCNFLADVELQDQDTSVFAYGDGVMEFFEHSSPLICNVADPMNLIPHQIPPTIRVDYLKRKELDQLVFDAARLNAKCIDGLARLLQGLYACDPQHRKASQQCAIFSTHDLVRTRFKTGDQELWASIQPVQYWTKLVWIFPIYRPRLGLWALAVVYIQSAHIVLYDPLGAHPSDFWTSELADLSVFIRRAAALAAAGVQVNIDVPSKWVFEYIVRDNTSPADKRYSGRRVLAWIPSVLQGDGLSMVDSEASLKFWWERLLAVARSVVSSV